MEQEAQAGIVSEPVDEAEVQLIIQTVNESLEESAGDLNQAIGTVLEIEAV